MIVLYFGLFMFSIFLLLWCVQKIPNECRNYNNKYKEGELVLELEDGYLWTMRYPACNFKLVIKGG